VILFSLGLAFCFFSVLLISVILLCWVVHYEIVQEERHQNDLSYVEWDINNMDFVSHDTANTVIVNIIDNNCICEQSKVNLN